MNAVEERRSAIGRSGLFTLAFLLAEAVLYYFIMTAGGETLKYCCFASVVLCFIYSLPFLRISPYITAGLGLTVGADFFLVLCSASARLWGMVFFLGVQSAYAVYLHRALRRPSLITVRICLAVLAVAVTVAVLGKRTDPLALVSLCYYAFLAVNILCACLRFRSGRLFALGLVLFLLCDTVIGLQVAAEGYLPIAEDTWLYGLIFSGFNLAWFFYLPSQVLIALSSREGVFFKKRRGG